VVFEICSECFHHLRYFYEGSTDQCTGVFEICRFSFHEEYRQHCIQTDSTIQTALSLECRAPPRSRDGRRRKNALALDVDSMNASILFVNFLHSSSSEFLCPLCAASFFHVRDQIRKIHTKKAETEIQTSKQKLRRNVFGMHAVRGNVTKPGSTKGKPQFATKPGSTKGKGPSSPLAWVNKRQGLRFVTVYSVSIYLSYGIFVEMSLKASRVLLK